MKIVLTGSLGHIGKPLTKQLVEKGHEVTVISRTPERQEAIETLGAEAAIGSLKDVDFLASTFAGADAVYCMVPPNEYLNHNIDPIGYYRKIGLNYVQAIHQTGVKRIVHLSSLGAHLDSGSGLILGHYNVEKILGVLQSEVSMTHLRPVCFYHNLYRFADGIKNNGFISVNYGEEDKVPWVSPVDIAATVAEELVIRQPVDRNIRYIASDERTCSEAAGILGEAIGKPDLEWRIIPDKQMQANLQAAGIPERAATSLTEMNASIHSGVLLENCYRNRPAVMGKIKMTDFAKEFASAYNQRMVTEPNE